MSLDLVISVPLAIYPEVGLLHHMAFFLKCKKSCIFSFKEYRSVHIYYFALFQFWQVGFFLGMMK
jgi:hypothetical protein